MKEKVLKFLAPNEAKILVFSLLIIWAILATIQAWGFSNDPASKPFLYDLIRPVPLWAALAYFLLPITLVTVPVSSIGFGMLVAPIAIIYMYLVSCLASLVWDNYNVQRKNVGK